MNYLTFKTLIFSVFFVMIGISGPFLAQAQSIINTEGQEKQTSSFVESSGFDPSHTVGSVIAMVIGAFLGLLAIIFIILILIAGYKWMTAGGNEEKVKEAKTQLQHAVIGLAIIIMAYAITNFVFEAVGGAAGGGSGPGAPTTSG